MSASDAADIRIRRCTVVVRRHGGWSWGDPRSYVAPAVVAIEDALNRAAAESAFPDGADVTLSRPVALNVAADGRVTGESLRALVDTLRAVVPQTPASDAWTQREQPSHNAFTVTSDHPDRPAASTVARDALAATLARWSRSGRLGALARSWSAASLDAWVAVMVDDTGGPVATTAALPPEAIEAMAWATFDGHFAVSHELNGRARFLMLAGAAAAAMADRAPDRATLAHIARCSKLPTRAAFAMQPVRSPPSSMQSASADASAQTAVDATTVDAAVVPALPFLVLVQLHRIGFLQPATAAFLAAGVGPAAASLAAVVAGKVLNPPHRGWRRTPDERLAVQLASGLTPAQVDAAASQCADKSTLLLTPLRSALVELYADGRAKHDEVILTRTGEDLLYGEAHGPLPIVWTENAEQAAGALTLLGAPPVRESDVFVPLIDALQPRKGLAGHDQPALERLLGSVVGTALGVLAQELWGEDADALVALRRLGDLEAQVTVRERVSVRVPRGQRWLDLRRAGLLDTWPVSWARGGLWELVTW